MKNYLVVTLLFSGLSLFSQDVNKAIQTGKWFPGYNITSQKIVYYKKPPGKTREETVEFRPNGKMIHCSEITESSLNKEGKEITTTHVMCDSLQTYEIKNGMMQIRLMQQTPNFYKIQLKGETFELIPVKSEADDKQ
jgi:hypothetical protein